MSAIPIADPDLGDDEKARVAAVLDDGMIADGPEVRRFEEEFADYCGAARGVATSNGTTALHAALLALGIGRGDRVVTTPFSFVATANAIRHCRAVPVFADIDPETYALDPHAVEQVIRDHGGAIDAVLAVHLYGLPADMAHLRDLADDYDLALIEDAAQAHGAEYRGRRAGSLGDAACFSFYPTKNMTTGEGGMIVTDRDDAADRASRFVNHGRTDTYEHAEVGHNFRMTSLAAAIGRAQLEKLPAYNRARRDNARRLTAALADVDGVVPPTEPDDCRHVYHQYTVRCDDRAAIRDRLDAAGVDTAVYYPIPIHRQPAYASVGGSFPIAERSAAEVLSLPVHPGLAEDDVETVAAGVRAAAEHTQLPQS